MINPEISCQCYEEPISSSEQDLFLSLISDAEVIINTIDCNFVYFDLVETYRKLGKLVICPFNPGFGGMAVCFTNDSTSSYDFFDTEEPLDDFDVAKCLLKKEGVQITQQVSKNPEDFLNGVVLKGYFSQLAVGAAITSGIVTTVIVDYLRGDPLKLSPDFYYLPANWTPT